MVALHIRASPHGIANLFVSHADDNRRLLPMALEELVVVVLPAALRLATSANPPGTAVGRAADRALGTDATGTRPDACDLDATTGNPPGTAATRTMPWASTPWRQPGGSSAVGTPAR